MSTRLPLPARALLALTVALSACDGGGPSDVGRPLNVQISGRLERSSVVTLTATGGGTVFTPAQLQVSITPAGAAEPAGEGKYRLLRAGEVVFSVTAQGYLGSEEVDVAAPPVVLFDRMVDGNRDIWRVDLDGQNMTRLTTNPGDDQDPTVARGRVVFMSYRDGNSELYEVPLAGGADKRLTTTGANETAPSLSPDGERLAYAHDPTGIPKLWVANGNGSGGQRLTPASFGFSGSVETAPSWAPTGNRLVFVATAQGSADLFRMSPPAAPEVAEGGDSNEVEPAWSPDGQWVAFTSNRSGNTDVYLKRISDGTVTALAATAATELQPAWTPDGRVVYTEFSANTTRLRWVDPADRSVTHPIPTGPELGINSAQHAAVAPAN